MLSSMMCFYMLNNNLHQLYHIQILLSHSVGCLYILLMVSFAVQKAFKFNSFPFIYFWFYFLYSKRPIQKILLWLMWEMCVSVPCVPKSHEVIQSPLRMLSCAFRKEDWAWGAALKKEELSLLFVQLGRLPRPSKLPAANTTWLAEKWPGWKVVRVLHFRHIHRECAEGWGHSRSLLPSLFFPRPSWQWRWWQKSFKGMQTSADKCLFFVGNFLLITSCGVSGMFLLREMAVSRRC